MMQQLTSKRPRSENRILDTNNEQAELAGENDESDIRRELRLKYRKVIDDQLESKITIGLVNVNRVQPTRGL